ncbi:Cys-tRNA(Pro) deacylase [Paraglaciecola aquimarina]|uniref:Cys-tRNA(Pro)/Cys-tRNA(Cys) deacylase n=1 Tax=Paraglaciecola algarum TaxID=3050085 RepID=A0ABS9D4I1_9ALTE|nr:Cys-tRNA(Pro) deacylase [Paraglaciecola sp. G1-23]MCF2947862.1 Cys-tRNA(Pro) deacylase [Paraglaciecola sp. G1-23]
MTPAINLLKKLKIEHKVHSYEHDESYDSYGLEAADKLNVQAQRVFKTLVVKLDSGALAVAILPVDKKLSMKLVAKALSAKKAEMADKLEVQRSTGYVLGGVSPLGQKKRLKTVVDDSASELPSIFVSAGKRGLEIELSCQDLTSATQGISASITVR